ncbi:hypothetical protein V2J09_019745 [Rumex salicifolius]
MAASFLIRSLPRLRTERHCLAVVLFFGQLRRPAFTTVAEESSCPLPSKEPGDELKVQKNPLFQFSDSYSALEIEKKEILQDVQRRTLIAKEIIHPGRYMDGERLSAEDEKVVMDNFLCYHPSAEDKIGCGLDYIMVGRHPQFRWSRCLFIVRTDGEYIDFSYKKCLRQYIRVKLKSHAEGFIQEYRIP